jgi:26S proteasome regulatory subunit N1
MQKQLAYILARQQIPLEGVEDDELLEILNNAKLSDHFKEFGKTLSLSEPRSLEDIYKSHLETTRGSTNVDSARQNLAGTFVNAFVNAGFGNDKLMVDIGEGQSWIYKNKEHGMSCYFVCALYRTIADQGAGAGMMSATASLGVSLLWDPENGLGHIDKYTYASEEFIKVRCSNFFKRRWCCAKHFYAGWRTLGHGYPAFRYPQRDGRCPSASRRIHRQQESKPAHRFDSWVCIF